MDKLLQSWFNTSRHGIAFVVPGCTSQGETMEFCYQLVNTAFARLVDRTPDELIGQPVSGFLSPDREANFIRQLLAVSQTGEEQQLEGSVRHADKEVWLQITLTRLDEAVQISVQAMVGQNQHKYQNYLLKKQKRYTQQLKQRVNKRTQEIEQLSALHQTILNHAGQAILSTDIYVEIAADIDSLKMAGAKFQQKNKELDTFFNGALDMHCISDAQGNLSKVNKALQTALGYSEAELIAIPFLYLLHPHEQHYVYQHLLAVILTQPVKNQTNRFRKKDGTYRTIEWSAIAIDNVVYGSARDITERQQTETQLRTLNQRLQLATRAAGQGIWESDLERGTLLWDERMWDMHGLKPGRTDWHFDELLSLIHPDDLPDFLARSQQNLRGDTANNVSRIIQPDGTVRYIESNGLITRNEQGKPSRAAGVAWDVTERKLAEESLRESEQRFREIAENVDEVFWVHAANPFRLLYVNAAYERVWNYSRQSLLDDHNSFLNAVLAEDHPAVLHLLKQYQAGIEGQLNCRIHGPGQSIRWISIRTFIIRNEAGAVTRHIGIANNITSQKEQELILQKSLHREQELNQLKSQFVATASHEFRTPLATIQSSVDLVRLYLDLPTATARQSIRHHLSVIGREIEKFGNLLTDMLTIGRIEAGKVSFRPHWSDVATLCESVITTHFSNRADKRTVVLRLEGNPRTVWMDDNLMSHVIVNLLSNAFKFSQEPPCLYLLFTVDCVQIDVIDTGIGIPAKDYSTLFQPFSRASNTAGIPGTGLGLVIARQFVDLHEGQLCVQSKENEGTTFTITLPTAVSGQPQPTPAGRLQPVSPSTTIVS